MIPVRVGLSDGQRTEISGPGVHEGMLVVTGLVQAEAKKSTPGVGIPFGTPGGSGGRGGR
jgi:hypothetical protein